MLITPGKLLGQINSPADLKKLDQAQLVQLSDELRHFIIDNVSVYGNWYIEKYIAEYLSYGGRNNKHS